MDNFLDVAVQVEPDRVEQRPDRHAQFVVIELARHLIAVGGKLVRPGFCLASSLVCDPAPESSSAAAVKGGASVELIHIGSLYHDDVMDGATTRRSVPSVNAQWGNLRAILASDLRSILGQAIDAAARDRAAELVRSTTGVEESRNTARMWADKAQAALTSLPDPRHRSSAPS